MQFRPKIKQVQNHTMPSAFDTPLKGRSMDCTLHRQSDSTKQQREGHNMHGLFQPRLEHKSTVKKKNALTEVLNTYSIKVNGTKVALSRLRPQETVGLAEKYSRLIA